MEYTRFGPTGMKVSRICLGCMSYGDPGRGRQQWALNEEDSEPFFRRAIEHGINFFDTANMYSNGGSEEVVGRLINKLVRRDEIVLATKVYFPLHSSDPNSGGLSRKAIFRELDASLKRLGTDYVDLYQIHRWDEETPIEETMEALHDTVKSGKVRYLGASSMHTWQFVKAQYVARLHHWTPFVSMQPHYNLIYREEEREMLPYCASESVAVIPWSPLARGRLARPADAATTSSRQQSDQYGRKLYERTQETDREVIDRVHHLAMQKGVPAARIALAWVLRQPGVTAPIIGATKLTHLDDAVAALEVELTDGDCQFLEEPYIPHVVVGIEP